MHSARPFHWGLIGPGRIAQRFAQAIQGLPETRLHAICSRDEPRAQHFATTWARSGDTQALVFSDLPRMLARDDIDAVYIATPHSLHADAVALCLQAGKATLCEKPLVPDLATAQRLTRLSQTQGVFLMEALWTRFLPAYDQVSQWLQADAIGALRAMQSSFCFSATFDAESRLFNPALAGGALLDIGIYCLSMTRWVLQQAWGLPAGAAVPTCGIDVHGQLAPTGVDQRVAGTLSFAHGVVSQFVCALDAQADNSLRIMGERGHIVLPRSFWSATQAELHRQDHDPLVVPTPFRINGFEGEIEEVMRCVRAGLCQSPRMPHDETLATLGWMDQMRKQLGVRYPFE